MLACTRGARCLGWRGETAKQTLFYSILFYYIMLHSTILEVLVLPGLRGQGLLRRVRSSDPAAPGAEAGPSEHILGLRGGAPLKPRIAKRDAFSAHPSSRYDRPRQDAIVIESRSPCS